MPENKKLPKEEEPISWRLDLAGIVDMHFPEAIMDR